MLAKMNRISVREYQGVDILKSLDIKNGVKVLDPVFLLDRNYWETFMHKGSEKDYILIYDFEGSDLMKRVALYFKRKKVGRFILLMTHCLDYMRIRILLR